MGKDLLRGGCGSLLLLLLLGLLPGEGTTATQEPQYLVLVPFLIHPETPEQICVQLSHLNESVSLSITLELGAQNQSLAQEELGREEAFRCATFQVPKQSGPRVALLSVLVQGETLRFWSRKQVLVKELERLLFVQTDKPIYKPGQNVQFRIVCLSEDFKPVNEPLPLVYIKDPRRNRLAQWRDVEMPVGLAQLSFPLTSEPPLGRYTVVVQTASGGDVERHFEVQEYVLPKFEVTVKAPDVITIEAEELRVTACAAYTYGKAVPGQVNLHVCRRFSDFGYGTCQGTNPEAICEDFRGQTDAQGCLSQVVKTKIFQLRREHYGLNLHLTATVTEEGTGVTLAGRRDVRITSTLTVVELERLDSHYKPGIPLFGQVRLVDGTQEPLANQTVRVVVGSQSSQHTTDAEGRVFLSIDTTNFTAETVSFQVTHKQGSACYDRNWLQPQHQQVYRSVPRFYSASQSYLSIQPVPGTLPCGHHQPLRVYYVLRPGLVAEKQLRFFYLVMAKGAIVRTGTHVLDLERQGAAQGVFSLDLAVGPDEAPLARLLLYTILPSGELLAHSGTFKVENCFRNQVTLRFSEPEGLPASQTRLHLSASPGSLCAIHAVDKSVFLLKPEAELLPETVYDLLPVKFLHGYQYKSHSLDEPNVNPCITLENVVVGGYVYSAVPLLSGDGDAYSILKSLGLKVFTSAKIHKPEICSLYQPQGQAGRLSSSVEHVQAFTTARLAVPMAVMESSSRDAPPAAAVLETVRKYFPETWLWELQRIGPPPEAEVELPLTFPDTITEWKAGAFCLSEEAGLGLAQGTFAKAFQPFFLRLTLPYSVVRGEAFLLRGTVFSYLQSCLRVRVTLAPSADFEASPVGDGAEESACLCRSGRKTVSWRLTPKALGTVNITASAEALASTELCGNEIVETPLQGRKDTVVKALLVEPEGEEKEVVFSSLLCAKEEAQSAPVSLKLPENVVEGSARASFCVLGDLLGSAIQNLHQLLRLPYGCGEQNMALLAPNIYILDYLNQTGQLTEEVRSKAIGYLTTGYQRQLNYKHGDGSYSTFGDQQRPGNGWLTAFVLKTFRQAGRYIYVDEAHVTAAQNALAARQKEDGCFRGTGTLLNNALMGGVDDDDEDILSAYVTIALLENLLPVTSSVVRNAMFCMETAAQADKTSPYTRALLAYAFSLAGKEDKRAELLRTLQAEAVKDEDGSIHWQQPKKEAEAEAAPRLFFYRPRAPSVEVELAAYVLMALLSGKPAPTPQELTEAAGIVKWLSQQQNPTGGFSSTQDTVVALQALALYSGLTYKPGSAGAAVSLRDGEGKALRQFQVGSANRLLLQCQDLPAVPGDYSPEVTGDGCVYMQTALKYNVHPGRDDASFALEVGTVPGGCSGAKARRTFDIAINVSYTGRRPASNMAIVDVKMLSGFVPVKPSVQKLRWPGRQVQRTEVSPSHVLLYLEKVSNVTQSFSFAVELDVAVESLKPAVVKVYDYYVAGESAVAQYSAPCSAGKSMNPLGLQPGCSAPERLWREGACFPRRGRFSASR